MDTHTHTGSAAASVALLLFPSALGQNKSVKETWRHCDLQGPGRGAGESALWLKRDEPIEIVDKRGGKELPTRSALSPIET